MNPKPVVYRQRARRDIAEARGRYLSEASAAVALRFLDALELAFERMGEHPASGSPRYASVLGIPGLRSWSVTGFPYLVFAVEEEAVINVWRVLHAASDVAAWLQEE
ncbi:MAG: type II toxin-antitoxin system RelE/ParE family toxin [Dehalococcoidia bacterium]|nr:type II toxin-antitoxin system RelE/ParE family toxin [Dehalococcoidia bacterium]MYK25820.1 type II toxin-antitoxin system RelE/ParE family toxin [Dehalococcoidia bacterium]